MATQKPRTKEQSRARRKVQEPVMPSKRWRAERLRIWRDMTGCTCTLWITVEGRTVKLRRDEMCSSSAIRCAGRAERWARDIKALGPDPSERAPKLGGA